MIVRRDTLSIATIEAVMASRPVKYNNNNIIITIEIINIA